MTKNLTNVYGESISYYVPGTMLYDLNYTKRLGIILEVNVKKIRHASTDFSYKIKWIYSKEFVFVNWFQYAHIHENCEVLF